jgi:hypothetical protein
MSDPIAILQPGDPASRTGGYIYNKRVVEGLRGLGCTVTLHRLADSFPDPDAAATAEAASMLHALPDACGSLLL